MDRSHAEHLRAERARAVEQADALRRSFDDIVAASEEVATDDEHDPEGHTIAWERQQVAALLAAAGARLAELDGALARVEAGTYGRCEVCDGPVGEERLEALPGTATCVACAA